MQASSAGRTYQGGGDDVFAFAVGGGVVQFWRGGAGDAGFEVGDALEEDVERGGAGVQVVRDLLDFVLDGLGDVDMLGDLDSLNLLVDMLNDVDRLGSIDCFIVDNILSVLDIFILGTIWSWFVCVQGVTVCVIPLILLPLSIVPQRLSLETLLIQLDLLQRRLLLQLTSRCNRKLPHTLRPRLEKLDPAGSDTRIRSAIDR